VPRDGGHRADQAQHQKYLPAPQGGHKCTDVRRQIDELDVAARRPDVHLGQIAVNEQQERARARAVEAVIRADDE